MKIFFMSGFCIAILFFIFVDNLVAMENGMAFIYSIGIVLVGVGAGSILVSITNRVDYDKIDRLIEENIKEFYDEDEEYEEEDKYEPQLEIAEPIPVHPALAHILLYGGAGQGKTALANVTRSELEKAYEHEIDFIETVPSQLKRKRELDEVMLRVASNPYCVLFIDEVHGLPLEIEESLYKAMQDFEYDITLSKDIVLGDGYEFKLNEETGVQTIELPKFTMIGCTTLMGKINKPLKDRFPIRVEMDDYEINELEDIIDVYMSQDSPNSFDTYIGQGLAVQIIKMHIKAAMYEGENIIIDNDAKKAIAELSMKTARLVKQRTKNCIAYAKSEGKTIVTPQMVEKAMYLFGVDENGLDRVHRDIIGHLVRQKNKPIGSQALAEAVNVTKYDIESVYVPELTKIGIVTRDGRSMKMLTEEAYEKYARL
jgi:Holliday junction DNA helicase RuvB